MTKLILALALTGCLDAQATESHEAAPLETDCSSELDACYKGCQARLPSPTAQCFDRCTFQFLRCLPQ